MGIYDRDYYQQEETPKRTRAVRQLRGASVTNKLLIANIVVYLVCWLLCTEGGLQTNKVYDALSIGNGFFESPYELWRLISYGFMHSPFWENTGTFFHILTNCFVLWMFGRFIEQRYGGAEFLRFYLFAIVFSGLVFVVTNLGGPDRQAVGASGGVAAIVILFCFLYPHEKLLIYGIIPIPAWLAGILFVGLDVATGIGEAHGAGFGIAWQAHLGGMAFAAAYYLLNWNFAFLGKVFSKRSPKLAIYREAENRVQVEDEPSAETRLIAQGEEILQQVHEKGETSLNTRQRKILERYSALLKQRRESDDGQYRI